MTKIAITRPSGKGEQLKAQLEQHQIAYLHTPVLSLTSITLDAQQLAPLDNADVIIFISQDAVQSLAEQYSTLPAHAKLFAVGEQTAQAIETHFSRKADFPHQQDSEGLLALKALQDLDAKQCVLVKGKGGRTLIATTCKSRGAILNQCVVYERAALEETADGWLDHWREQQITAIVLSSNAAIDAVFNTQSEQHLDWLKQRDFYLVSQRSCDYLQQEYQIAETQVYLADGASDDAVFSCIKSSQKQQVSTMSEEQKQPTAASEKPSVPETKPMKQKISKVGVLALLIATATGVMTTGLIVHGQQISDKTYAALDALKTENSALKSELKQSQQNLAALQSEQSRLSQAVNQSLSSQAAQLQESFAAQLDSKLRQADQQLSGAAINEAVYLHRLAVFKVAAEQDYQGGAAVLKRVHDVLLAQSNNTEVLKALADDIALLNAQPQPAVESIYLELHGLLNQVDTLPIKSIERQISEMKTTEVNEALSSDISDWKSNVARSFDKLVDELFTIKRSENIDIDVLLNTQETQLIAAQLRGYFSQAQTALMDKQASVFFTALTQAQMHLDKYFNAESSAVKAAKAKLVELEQQPLVFSRKVELSSEQALKEWLND
ncbi:uroporphyrinogen-III C-methyltransferase [Pseudoalteromonas phenolica]|uniref:uroporphyrinogen-III C-methyltransferase n=1 Tax=Pseudoalteromonas phenolica TaxID=161398 RepID=UPI00110B475A|nr:uroporphyrinogen-III C-methyltransferase [Pseudoalteromonas phenolica]TMO53532.1 uroporphyrinogen-III synthase [Pseudoalteromonas phenolica]